MTYLLKQQPCHFSYILCFGISSKIRDSWYAAVGPLHALCMAVSSLATRNCFSHPHSFSGDAHCFPRLPFSKLETLGLGTSTKTHLRGLHYCHYSLYHVQTLESCMTHESFPLFSSKFLFTQLVLVIVVMRT